MAFRVLVLLAAVCTVVITEAPLNDRPIIGVLSQELSDYYLEQYGDHASYIAASYVKYLEGAGSRVVPIMINQSQSYYEEIVNHTNGVLFPGGAANLAANDGYADAGWTLYRLAITKNKAGEYFPVWGTCLGFELLTFLGNNRVNILASCDADNFALPLDFKPDYKKSRLFQNAPENIVDILASENVTANFHIKCVTEKNLTAAGMDRDWHVLSVNKDSQGLEFVSTLEHRQYPIYGVQYHPEKNNYEWKPDRQNPHFEHAILVSQYFANFFVNEARKSSHHFPSVSEERDALIYNYQPQYTGKNDSTFEQIYFFDN